ncbi:MAG: S-adenosylmethionine:tRNA ribosyltransferase-isomerase [Odoribacteraceae bacterium]|jgi:S-adenosylmethionine:tRNA ribosyltransferase-isomerase|nr:S-adenosylmethionine:tRNA ribosyltransferase-isomerase [Odoribacteraceae bacterium]
MLQEIQEINIEEYAYELPEERVARFPLERREDARLLILQEKGEGNGIGNGIGNGVEFRESHFRDMPALLREKDLLVFNNTRVIRARLSFYRETGARVELFCLEPAGPPDHARNFAATGACEWYCLVGNARRWKGETLACRQSSGDNEWSLRATRVGTSGDATRVRFEWDAPLTFSEVLEASGQIPIPPYLGRDAVEEDLWRYQTVYSRNEGSVAAPTAGLHFSEEVLQRARATGAILEELTLHVGAGTFKPVKSARFGDHEMHAEHFEIPRALVSRLLSAPRAIAVGTTSTRSLESLYWMGVKLLLDIPSFNDLGQWEAYALPGNIPAREALEAIARYLDETGENALRGRSRLAIAPGYTFRLVEAMFTNFHQPRSTLLLLVAAAVGERWRELYARALASGFRFLSYGDGCFLRIAGK